MKPSSVAHWRLFLLLLCLAWPLASEAHKASDSYLQIGIDNTIVTARWDIALRDLDQATGLDTNQDGNLTWGELRSRQQQIWDYALTRLRLTRGAQGCLLTLASMGVSTHVDGRYVALDISGNCPRSTSALKVNYRLLFDMDRQHRGLAVVNLDGQAHSLIFSPDSAEQEIGIVSAWKTLGNFIAEGIHHILIGYDHILFLLSLLLPAVLVWRDDSWQPHAGFKVALGDTARTVTAFTLAHSVTLALAALGILRIDSRLVESAIALSVIIAAANNLRPFIPARRWSIAFVFGLIHGFGFASVLSEIGLPRDQLAIALGGFNIGVELGQMIIVALFLPLACLLRNTLTYRIGVARFGSVAIMLIAGYWFIQRAFDLAI